MHWFALLLFGGKAARTEPAENPMPTSRLLLDQHDHAALSEEGLAKLCRRARREEAKLFQRFEKAVGTGERGRYEALQKKYLASFHVKLAYLLQANARMSQRFRREKRELVNVAREMNLFSGLNEEIRVTAKLKSSGGTRIIQSFGVERRAAQMMADAALRPFLSQRADPRQRTIKTGEQACGTHALVADLRDAIDQGARWVVELDIVDCFPSLDRSLLHRPGSSTQNRNERRETGNRILTGLPLPRAIIDQVVIADQSNLTPIPTRNTDRPYGTHIGPVGVWSSARRGISQGSHCSSIVLELVIADIMAEMPNVRVIRTFADNVFVATPTKSEAVAISKALSCIFNAATAGRIRLQERQPPRKVSNGVNVLGYRVVRRGGETIVDPCRENRSRLAAKLRRMLAPAKRGVIVRIAPILKMIRDWAGAYKLWSKDTADLIPFSWCFRIAKKYLGIDHFLARAIFGGRNTQRRRIERDRVAYPL